MRDKAGIVSTKKNDEIVLSKWASNAVCHNFCQNMKEGRLIHPSSIRSGLMRPICVNPRDMDWAGSLRFVLRPDNRSVPVRADDIDSLRPFLVRHRLPYHQKSARGHVKICKDGTSASLSLL